MFASNVAPRRRVKPAPKPWTCACHEYGKPDHPDAAGGMQPRYVNRRQPAHLTVCPDCHTRREDTT